MLENSLALHYAFLTFINIAGLLILGAARAFFYLIPVIAVICGALIPDEAVTLTIIVGGAFILAGVGIAQFGASLLRY